MGSCDVILARLGSIDDRAQGEGPSHGVISVYLYSTDSHG